MSKGFRHPEIYLRPQRKTYYVRWTQGGKRRWKALIPPGKASATKDPTIAKRLYKEFLEDFYSGKVIPLRDHVKRSFHVFCKEFLKDVEYRLSHKTYLCYEDALEKAKKIFGDIPLNDINIRLLEKYQTNLLSSGMARPTVNKHYRHLKAAINKAIDWEYMEPLKKRFPKQLSVKKKSRFLSEGQIRMLLSKIDDHEFYDFCLFSLFTGMRSGEIIRLTFDDIDNPAGFIRILDQKNKDESNHPINSIVRDLIERCKKRRSKETTLFRFNSIVTISHLYKKYAIKAELKDTRFHDLRHSYASHIVMRGESLKIVQELMRHKSFSSTLVYAHLAPKHLTDASNRVGYGPIPGPPNSHNNKK